MVGRLGPAKRLRVGIMGVNECVDVSLEVLCRPIHAAPDLLFGDEGEETLNLVDLGFGLITNS